MLRQRILTAIVLLAVVAAALIVDTPWPFMVLLSAATGAALWEWLRLTASDTPASLCAGVVLFLLCLVLAQLWIAPSSHLSLATVDFAISIVIPLATLAWLLLAPTLVFRGRVESAARSPLLSLFAIVALLAAWSSLAIMFLKQGAWYVVSLLILVWVADSVAYFVGRALGRHKLAPRVSPGKSIEGAMGGLAGGIVWILASGQYEGSYGHELIRLWGMAGAALAAALLVAVSIVGDLFESLLKRRAGRKDSSQLLPGHGGVYDRIDAILPVAPLAVMLIVLGTLS